MTKSTLLAEIRAVPTLGGTRNRIDGILLELDADDADALRVALRDPTILPSQITRALGNRGIKVGNGSVRNWRVANG